MSINSTSRSSVASHSVVFYFFTLYKKYFKYNKANINHYFMTMIYINMNI